MTSRMVSLRMDEELLEWLEKVRRDVPRSVWVRKAVEVAVRVREEREKPSGQEGGPKG